MSVGDAASLLFHRFFCIPIFPQQRENIFHWNRNSSFLFTTTHIFGIVTSVAHACVM